MKKSKTICILERLQTVNLLCDIFADTIEYSNHTTLLDRSMVYYTYYYYIITYKRHAYKKNM